MTTPKALEMISEAVESVGSRIVVGVGTVLDERTCAAAIEAGAEFIVSPICKTELVAIAHRANRPIMLGACTPTEAQRAYEAGSDFVKLFPSEVLGPGYMRALLAPLPHLRIVPTGGVEVQSVAPYFSAGCVAVGVGSALVSTKLVQEANWRELTRRSKEFVAAARAARSQ